MTTERLELLPGVWLNQVQTDRFKTGCFSINFLRPLARESAAANALLPSVLLRGCRSYPNMQAVSQRLDTLYGASVGTLVRKKGEVQTTGLYADFLEDRYSESEPVFVPMIEFLQELLFEPCKGADGFVEDFVTGEKQNLANTIDAKINEKRSYAVSRLLHHMCEGEAYAVPRLGEKETLDGLTPGCLFSQWNRILAGSRIELFYLGQQPREAVLDAMACLTEKLPHRDSLTDIGTQVTLPHRPAQEITETMDVTQGKLTMGFRTPVTLHDSRYPALALLNAVYGAGMTSKLFLNIREKQSLCYYASSSLDKFKGIMVVGSGIEFDNYQVAKEGILNQLELCCRGEITPEELESARNYLISALHTGKDSPGRLDDYAIGQAVAGCSGTMESLAQQLETVTLDQVVEAANTLTLDTVYFLKGETA